MLAAQIRNRHSRFDLLGEPDDLLSRKSALAHIRPPWVDGLSRLSIVTASGGQVSPDLRWDNEPKLKHPKHFPEIHTPSILHPLGTVAA